MKWASPFAFVFLIPLVLVFAAYFLRSRTQRGTFKFSSAVVLKKARSSVRQQLVHFPLFLKLAATALAIVALARPQSANSKVNRNVEGIDIMIAMDVSDSMEIEDMQPQNRIEAAKSVIRNFIKGRVSDRIGLIIFAGESYTRCPLTLDYKVLVDSLNTVTTDNIKQGTAIGVALANGVARLKDSTAKSRVMVLLTDGENNTGTIDPATATEIAKGYGIKIYTIGIGKDGDSMLPNIVTDAFGRKIKTYTPIHSTVNMELLENVANETGGKSFRATDTDALKKVFAQIDKLEKTKIEVSEYVKYNEDFAPWLTAALILYLLQYFLATTVLRRNP